MSCRSSWKGVLTPRVWHCWIVCKDAFQVSLLSNLFSSGTELTNVQQSLIARFLDHLLLKMLSLSPSREETARIITCRADLAFGRDEKNQACKLYLEAAACTTRFFLSSEQEIWTSGDQHVPARLLECLAGDARSYCVVSQLMPRPDYNKCFLMMRNDVNRLIIEEDGREGLEKWVDRIWDLQLTEFLVHFLAQGEGKGVKRELYRAETRLRAGHLRVDIEGMRFLFMMRLLVK
jgi:hypothetical protein